MEEDLPLGSQTIIAHGCKLKAHFCGMAEALVRQTLDMWGICLVLVNLWLLQRFIKHISISPF